MNLPMKTTLKQLLLDAILAVLIFTQITGCATMTYEEKEILNDPNRYRVFVPAREQIVTNSLIPSISRLRHYVHNVNGMTKWSNGYQDIFWCLGEFHERQTRYVLLALELNPGEESKDVTLEVTSLGDELVLTPYFESTIGRDSEWLAEGLARGAAPLFILLSPFILLAMLIRKGTESPGNPETPKSTKTLARPFEGCCFVWLADVETGETVAGESPAGAKIVFSESLR